MFYNAQNNVLLVFQGEFGITKEVQSVIQTTITPTSRIIIIYNSASNILGVAHMDDFTSPSIIYQLAEAMQHESGVPKKLEFHFLVYKCVNYVSGEKGVLFNRDRTGHPEVVKNILSTCKQGCFSPLELQNESPIQLAVVNCAPLPGVIEKKADVRLTELQQRENEGFKQWIDREYHFSSIKPSFEGKRATRTLNQLTTSQHIDTNRLISSDRTIVVPREKMQELYHFIKLKPEPRLQKAFEEKQFNLLLRLSAVGSDYLSLLNFLLENSTFFGIDINAQGKTSGTALDVATRFNNREAIALLTKAQSALSSKQLTATEEQNSKRMSSATL